MRTSVSNLNHVFLRPKVKAARGARFNAGRLKTLPYTIRAECAFKDFFGFRIELRDIEGAARNTVTAANAVILLEIDDAVLILNNDAIGRTRAQTSRILAVHALVLAH